ncbi:glutamine synthetase/guanido kinase [Nadsonia fulvescens var. elongata DSM 6958]|uniref:Glutamine synthetase n=1 Tax=Nadsonia fulvescens var. elongata DSM 6958 TaxID=857566 RepID=A0A1E3PU18_9ASCO|nr:glutamine synthetase/guanido kinase [Nadsonia fulvescens var. elongata DSM 6958]
MTTYSYDKFKLLLENDTLVKLAGVDCDGILRGKVISIRKFHSVAKSGFGFCSVLFGWDMHDKTYAKEGTISNVGNGYKDLLAKIDFNSFRRIPWENNVPFFLVSFCDSETGEPIAPCPRGLVKSITDKYQDTLGCIPMAGAEFEFYNYKETPDSLEEKNGVNLKSLTPGMFGYSITRPSVNRDFYYAIFNDCNKFNCEIEGWHTETGPGVYEAAIGYSAAVDIADKAVLFKLACKSIGYQYGIVPCFMAKPQHGMPGNSGHLHVSLVNESNGKNLFAREEPDVDAKWPDLVHLSDIGRHFLAGVLQGLPDIMPLLAPTINSYKRLVENFWAPVTVSWGLEHRIASIRLIAPPTSSASATRFEIRTPGADVHPHYALAGILALGLRGIKEKLEIDVPPMAQSSPDKFQRLPKNLRQATERFMDVNSLARKTLGDAFVDHYGATRLSEVDEWDQAVTNWETSRYMEIV